MKQRSFYFLNQFILAIFVLSLFSSTAFSKSYDVKKASKWEEISAWKTVGKRWAIAYNDKKEAIAIYDLSYSQWWKFSNLGNIPNEKLNLFKIVTHLKDAAKDDPDNLDEINSVVSKIEESEPPKNTVWPNEWWKDIEWKNSSFKSDPPSQFTMNDINLDLMSKNEGKFNKILNELDSQVAKVTEGKYTMRELLSSLVYSKSHSGSYDVYFYPKSSIKGVTKPQKIADLKSKHWGFVNALVWKAIEEGVDQLIGLIPIPIVNAIIDTAFSRFFYFNKLMRRSHQNMVVELLNEMKDHPANYKGLLTEDEHKRAVQSVMFAATSLTSYWKWVFKGPYKDFEKDREKESKFLLKATDWYGDKGYSFGLLSTRFSFDVDNSGNTKYRLLGRRKLSRKSGPKVAIDFEKPKKLRNSRIALEVLSTAVTFGSEFLPLIGGIIKSAYNKFVVDPIKKDRIWEARMLSHLEQRQTQGETYEKEIQILYSQRVNPFLIKKERMEELIDARRRHFNIQ